MKKLTLTLVILTLIVAFALSGIVSADSPAVNCPASTSELTYMGEDDSACFYSHDVPRSNEVEVIQIDK